MKLIQHWKGVITEITDVFFYARMNDLTNVANPESELCTEISSLKGSEKYYLEVGATFDLRIVDRNGNLFNDFSFTREFWTKEDLDEANELAEKLKLFWINGVCII